MSKAKRKGDEGELYFQLRAHQFGLTTAIPFGDNRPYDFLVEGRSGAIYKAQVKVCNSDVLTQLAKYENHAFDFLFILKDSSFIVIPFEIISGKDSLRISKKLVEEFSERWEQII